jgi:hypothetical protein
LKEESVAAATHLEAEWKGVSDKFVSIGGLWRIARDEEVSDEYLACVIRWTMTSWPKREELRKGSTSFRTRFTEIQQDYARHMEEMGWGHQTSPRAAGVPMMKILTTTMLLQPRDSKTSRQRLCHFHLMRNCSGLGVRMRQRHLRGSAQRVKPLGPFEVASVLLVRYPLTLVDESTRR